LAGGVLVVAVRFGHDQPEVERRAMLSPKSQLQLGR
jgi:hypothetical protein